MHVTTGTFATPHASKYVQQLAKHFAHKLDVTHTPTEATLAFDFGTVHASADPERLTVRIELKELSFAPRARDVVDRHLARFAFRESFQHMRWDGVGRPSLPRRALGKLVRAAKRLRATARGGGGSAPKGSGR